MSILSDEEIKEAIDKSVSRDRNIDVEPEQLYRYVAEAQDLKNKAEYEQKVGEIFEPNKELLEVGRKAIEDVLVEWRDNRLSECFRGNGLVIKEKDGKDSHIIRFGPETALVLGLKAMGQALKGEK